MANTLPTPEFLAALDAFVKRQQEYCDVCHYESWGKHGKTYQTLSIEQGNRYVKIVTRNGIGDSPQASVFGFVDKETGDILKAATWRTPAKNFRRGNIYRDPTKVFPWTGVS